MSLASLLVLAAALPTGDAPLVVLPLDAAALVAEREGLERALIAELGDRRIVRAQTEPTGTAESEVPLPRSARPGPCDAVCRERVADAAAASFVVASAVAEVEGACAFAVTLVEVVADVVVASARGRAACDPAALAAALAAAGREVLRGPAPAETGRLGVSTEGRGGRVFVDGLPVGLSTPVRGLPVVPGPHEVEVVTSDRRAKSKVEVPAGKTLVVRLDVGPVPLAEAPVEEDLASAPWFWALVGGALAATALGVGLGLGLGGGTPDRVTLFVTGPRWTVP